MVSVLTEGAPMSTSLTQQLQDQNQAARAMTPPQVQLVMDRATDELGASGLADSALAVGDVAPDFTLPDAHGSKVSLSELLDAGPVVLAFYRGNWCPYCNTQLIALQDALPELNAAGATLVAISPQVPDGSLTATEKHQLTFPVLSDVGNVVADAYRLTFTLPDSLQQLYQGFGIDLLAANADATFRLPLPATFVIAADRTITWRFVQADYTKRADPADIMKAIPAI